LGQFSEQGYLPEAMMNYLANLGWNDGTPKEIYTPDELVQAFDMSRIIKSAAVFDIDKLKWINGQHIRLKAASDIQPLVIESLKKSVNDIPAVLPQGLESTDKSALFLNLATKIAQRDMELISDSRDIIGKCLQFDLDDTIENDPHVTDVLVDDLSRIIQSLNRDLVANTLPIGNESNFAELWKAYVKNIGKELGLKGKGLFHPLRFAITARMSGPDIGDIMQMISNSDGVVNPEYKVVTIPERVKILQSLSISESKLKAEKAVETRALAEKARLEAEASKVSEAIAVSTLSEADEEAPVLQDA